MNPEGIVIHPSRHTVKETIDRLVVFLQQHGTTVYARINQQSELNNVGLKIHPLEFILIGNPKAGGLALRENPVAGLDFPLKVIAWEDGEKKVWLAYNAPAYIEGRYSLPHVLIELLDIEGMISGALTG
ncbi:MAG TPA: DUF302 domain-containing protein [Puia sp.]|jgi:uncharacterized protein (DUF302 family)|nr:DUF302 domain-containing protein [Puia sp.]